MKKIREAIEYYFTLGYTKLTVASIILLILCGTCAYIFRIDYKFLSSILGNIFAGLITGIYITIFTSARDIKMKKFYELINAVNDAIIECYKFVNKYDEVSKRNTFSKAKSLLEDYYGLCNMQKDLNIKFDEFKFKGSRPAVGDIDDCMEEMKRLGHEIIYHKRIFEPELEEYLESYINSAYVMIQQYNTNIRYLSTFIEISRKMII